MCAIGENRPHRARATRSRICLALFAVAMAALTVGCQQPRVTSPTKAGHYLAGTRIVLADGISLTVPASWETTMYTDGARVDRVGILPNGATLDLIDEGKPSGLGGAVVVYALPAQFAARSRAMEELYRTHPDDMPIARIEGPALAGTKAVTYVRSYKGQELPKEVTIFLQPQGRDPAVIWLEVMAPPPGSALASAAPQALPGLVARMLELKTE
jgi:hypothetical protein